MMHKTLAPCLGTMSVTLQLFCTYSSSCVHQLEVFSRVFKGSDRLACGDYRSKMPSSGMSSLPHARC